MMMEADRESIHANTKHLPHELVIEVLSWLPAHYLLQFKCVSKTWLQLLTLDPHFAQLHLDRSIQSNPLNPNPSILSMRSGENINLYYAIDCTSSDRSIKLTLPFHEGVGKLYNCIGVCNGLLCYSDKWYTQVYVGNPLTKDYISISCPPPSIRFPGLNNDTIFGFGYDQASNKYKVIRAFCENDFFQSIFHSLVSIYTLGVDSSWRILDEDIQYDLCIETDHIPFANGALHWFSWGKSTPSMRAIVAFDLKNEVFQEIPRPSLKDDDFADFDDIGELGGLLCMYGYNIHHHIVFDFEIWIMKEYGVVGSWTKVFKIEDWQPYFYLRPLGFAKNGELISVTHRYKLVFYNPETKSAGILKQQLACVYTYIGSIISPRVISGGGQSLKEECI